MSTRWTPVPHYREPVRIGAVTGPALEIQSGAVTELCARIRERVGPSRGVTAVLEGAPGVGKTTTLDALTAELAHTWPRIHRVSADEPGRRRPFGLAAALAGVEPEYPPPRDLGDRILEAVERLCADQTVVLVGDDLHHADGDSLRLISMMADATRDLPLVLVLAHRRLPVREGLLALAAREDSLDVEVVGMDADAVRHLVAGRVGAPPGPRLTGLLAVAGGNPFHARALVDDLVVRDRLAITDGVADLVEGYRGAGQAELETVYGSVRAHLRLVDRPVRDLLQVLAVWGRPADVVELAQVAGTAPGPVASAVQTALDARLVVWADEDHLAFAHDLYRDVLYADLAPGVRRLLHAAVAAHLRQEGDIATLVAEHDAQSGRRPDPTAALRTVAHDLEFAPDQAVDVLNELRVTPGSADADAVAVAKAGALAGSGRMRESEDVARQAIDATTDPAVRDTLTRLLLHGIISEADTDVALSTIDRALLLTDDVTQRHLLLQLRRWVIVLSGRDPVPEKPTSGIPRTGAALVPTALELFLRARCGSALATVLEAQERRVAAGSPVWADGASAPAWPPWFALYAQGPREATEMSLTARERALREHRMWLFPYHLVVSASVDRVSGRYDDALTTLTAATEAAAYTGTGWVSRPTGELLQVHVLRGDLDVARDGLATWVARGLPEEMGLPLCSWVDVLLHEAAGDSAQAARGARHIWERTIDSGRVLWGLMAGVEAARVALEAGDDELLSRIDRDLSAVDTGQARTLDATPELVAAMTRRDAGGAARAAARFHSRGHVLAEAYAWEEAAVAAAAGGDVPSARGHAQRALAVAGALGARTVERRVAARLRAHDVRLGSSGSRRRPAVGWDSLTPTELQVSALVAQGLTSPQIAQRLFLSPRTVQTHISHILRKLGLASRVELATLVARRSA